MLWLGIQSFWTRSYQTHQWSTSDLRVFVDQITVYRKISTFFEGKDNIPRPFELTLSNLLVLSSSDPVSRVALGRRPLGPQYPGACELLQPPTQSY